MFAEAAAVSGASLWGRLSSVTFPIMMSSVGAAGYGWASASRLLWRAGFALLALGVLDYGLQRWRLLKSLKMTKQEVRDEMRQVAWPSRAELINYTSVVLTTLFIMIGLIFVLNLGFGRLITLLFNK